MSRPQHGKLPRSFEEELTRLKKHKDRLALPRPSLAMWVGDVQFWTDLRDPAQFNEQYVETHFGAEDMVSDAYMVSTWHTVALIATIAVCMSDRVSILTLAVELIAIALLSVFFFGNENAWRAYPL